MGRSAHTDTLNPSVPPAAMAAQGTAQQTQTNGEGEAGQRTSTRVRMSVVLK